MALPYRSEFVGVGRDSGEKGNPPSKFQRVFAKAKEHGLHLVAHAGEEGPATYIHEAIDLLHVERIDHGGRCDEDPALVKHLAAKRIPLTVCPLSNLKLRVVKDLREHNFAKLLRAGVHVTINSDAPAYFGGYIGENYRATADALDLTAHEIIRVAENAANAAFLSEDARMQLLVAMPDALALRGPERTHELPRDAAGGLDAELAELLPLAQRLALQPLHDEVRAAIRRGAEREHVDDVRVADLVADARLGAEPLHGLRLAVAAQDLDRRALPNHGVLREVHVA